MTINQQRTIAVVGGSYVGMNLAKNLLPSLPASHRVVVVEANSHFNHLFTFPRFAVLHRGGEEKALIPYTHALDTTGGQGKILHAKAVSIHSSDDDESRGWLKLDRSTDEGDRLEFDYLAIATGTQLQRPWSLPSNQPDSAIAKRQAVETLRSYQDAVKQARKIVIVGGGAVGVQVACDIAELYPGEKSVTLLHSRDRVMNKFHSDLHDIVSQRFQERGVSTVLGSRVVIPASGSFPDFVPGQTFNVDLQNGSSVQADLVLMCTGQTPRSDLLSTFSPQSINKDGFINVHPTLQISSSSSSNPHPLLHNMFALGDIADSGASKTVRAAFGQIEIVKSNILSLINREEKLKEFTPGPSGIHLSLGLYESIKFGNPAKEGDRPMNKGIERDLSLDMGIEGVWRRWNVPEGTPWHL
ncbi:Apoptosis-inducing factor 1 [Pseudozyma hubeiensis]|nr:Apoptosis-inducing factor 1 [Pseudozyma hubeiensis]